MACEPPHDSPGRCGTCGMNLVRVEAPAGPQGAELLAVPVTAVLDSGLRQIVWVEREPGRYEAAPVQLGPRAGDHYPVLAGLTEGQRVVVHGAFLLDSQAQIEGRPSLLYPRGLLAGDAPPAPHAGHEGH
jgi:Cu(I)/Ag(I) efflux system membrane fusion protein